MSKGTTTSELPQFQQDQLREIYDTGRELAGQPFVPFTGQQIAGFSGDELRSFDLTRGLTERTQQFRPEMGLRRLAQQDAPSLLDADIGAYQSPFQDQVIDLALGDIQRQQDIAQQRAQDQAIGAGAFGGSRSAILESEATRPFAEQAARTAANLRQAGFEQAQRAAESDIARQQAQQRFQAGLLGDERAAQFQTLGLLGRQGAQQRGLQQAALQAARGEFDRALQYGPQQFGLLASGGPGFSAGQINTTQPSTLDNLTTAASLLGIAFSDKKLKENIEYLGKFKSHNLYRWKWNHIAKKLGINTPQIGVMAQEILQTNPHAVTTHPNGYLMVNYSLL